MKPADLVEHRLWSQQCLGPGLGSALEVVTWMGAMQAQDYPMARWAVGLRMQEATDKEIAAVIDRGEILRTHVLRPTWHLVAAEDIYWMLALTAPGILSATRSRHQQLGLTKSFLHKCYRIMEKSLRDGRHLTRTELMTVLQRAHLRTEGDNRAAHITFCAELEGILCSGASKGKAQTYALLTERVPARTVLPRDAALETLATRYFRSHGPATVQDFTWWSGLPAKDARKAHAMIRNTLSMMHYNDRQYWFGEDGTPARTGQSALLLPAYDEFLISYKDRSTMLSSAHIADAISANGLFRPIITSNRKVWGLWKRTIQKDVVTIETQYFERAGNTLQSQVRRSSTTYGKFLQKEIVLSHRMPE